jgi:hypothetical protein
MNGLLGTPSCQAKVLIRTGNSQLPEVFDVVKILYEGVCINIGRQFL